MAGKSSSQKTLPSSSSSGHRKSRWEGNNPPTEKFSGEPKHSKEDLARSPAAAVAAGPSKLPIDPSPPSVSGGPPFPLADAGAAGGGGYSLPPQAPAYGFHMLERRTIVLADGSVRSYFALPPDYPSPRSMPDLPPGRPPAEDRLYPYGPPHPGLGDPRGLDRIGMDKPFPSRFSPEGFDSGFPRERDREDYRNLDNPLKRKYGEDDAGFGEPDRFYGSRFLDEEIARQRQQLLQYGNPNGLPGFSGSPLGPGSGRLMDELRMPKVQRHGDVYGASDEGEGKSTLEAFRDVDKVALRKSFLRLTKVVNENVTQRKEYLDDGKSGPLRCIVCGRTSKEFADMHCLIMHAFNAQNAELRSDHLGLHKALCVLLGWSYTKQPENSKIYQSLSADEAAANRDDLVIWPPLVIIHNTNTGRRKDGRMDGIGNKDMDIKLKELGFGGGKSKSMYGKDGHLGVTLVKFAATPAGLKECERLAEYFEKDNRGRGAWSRVQASHSGGDDDKNPELVKVDERTGEKKRVFYGYIGTAFDLEKVDFDLRKKALIKSRKDFDLSD